MPFPKLITWPLLAAALAFSAGGSIFAQEFPSRPIRFIVPNNPGAGDDLMGRILAAEVSRSIGQPVVVENKPGAGQLIGAEYVAKQVPADGYTILVSTVSSFAVWLVSVKDLRFDPVKDFSPVIRFGEQRALVASSSQQPWKNFGEMVAYVKANPGKLNYGASALLTRLLIEPVVYNLGLNMVFISYPGGAQYNQALLAGEVHLGGTTLPNIISFGDRIRVLAVSGDTRFPPFPDAPTFRELNLVNLPNLSYSLNAPAGTPKAVIERLYAASSKAVSMPDVKAQFAKLRIDVTDLGPEAASKDLAEQIKFFTDIAQKLNIQRQ